MNGMNLAVAHALPVRRNERIVRRSRTSIYAVRAVIRARASPWRQATTPRRSCLETCLLRVKS